MNYQETVNWMYNQLPMYQNQGISAYKKDLTNILLFANYLGNPEKKIKCIHVAGTNGKGSTAHMLASIFQEAGYKTGLYTSPHLKDYRERIKINGKVISESFVCKFISSNKSFLNKNHLSFFEMSVGMAFDYFNTEKIEIAIIEVGLGGRLDSTNIITPILSVITNIGLDHTQILGTTLEEIAGEKAGIIKPNIPTVVGEYSKQTKKVFIQKAEENFSKLYFTSNNYSNHYISSLKGDYQIKNIKTVLQAIHVIQEDTKFIISESNIKKGFLNVITNTGIQGRWQQLQDKPKVICDTAHNQHGLKIVLKQIKKQKFNQLHIVLGVVNDKDLEQILPLFPKKAIYYFCKPNNKRGLNEVELQQKGKQHSLIGEIYNSVTDAYQSSLEKASTNDFIFIGGSNFVVAEIL